MAESVGKVGGVPVSEHGLKANAISFWEGLVVALASTAPAYSLAAVIGSMAVIVGFFAPAALILAFVPMFFHRRRLLLAQQGRPGLRTTFAWVTRAMGPETGWIAGWAVVMTGILVVDSLADVATYTFYDLIGADGLYNSEAAVTIGAVLLIGLMTPDRHPRHRSVGPPADGADGIQIIPLLLFIVVVLVKVWSGDGPGTSFDPQLAWFNPLNIDAGNLNPFSAEAGDLVAAMLLGIFIYWGWESAVNLNEETEGEVTRPGLAGLISTLLPPSPTSASRPPSSPGRASAERPSSTTTRGSCPPTRRASGTTSASSSCSQSSSLLSPRPRRRSSPPRTSLSMARHEAIRRLR